jgi:hypothetical protein
MTKATYPEQNRGTGDLVLQEVWRAKDALSAQYGHDLDKLFADTRKREKLSGHPLVRLPVRRHKKSNTGESPNKAAKR